MHYNSIKKIVICFVIGGFITAMSTNVFAGGSFSFTWGKDSEPEQQQVKHKHKHKKSGPPAHAPAHGYRAKHQYRYYPSSKVYHDTRRGLYFYLKGDNWEVGASLPNKLQAEMGSYVNLELDTDKPYVHNAEHVKKYPPGQIKKKHKKWAKKKK
jgi:hypothetical protein